MKKNDGSLSLHGTVTPLMELLLKRRSFRKYATGRASQEQVEHILTCVRLFQETAGFQHSRIAIVEQGPQFKAIVKAAMSGVIGKINPWLAITRARHLILCGAIYAESDERPAVELTIKQASMTMQVAILAATEAGLATCWMAGINHERVETEFPMPDGAKLIAMSTLGIPPTRKGLSWDAIAYHLVSKRRKPLENLWMQERWRDES